MPNIRFLLQGCRAILIDKDRNPKVWIVSYLVHWSESGADILIVLHYLCILVVFFGVLAVDASKVGTSAWRGCWTIFLQNWWSTVGRFEPTYQTFPWKKYRVQALIEGHGRRVEVEHWNGASVVVRITHYYTSSQVWRVCRLLIK